AAGGSTSGGAGASTSGGAGGGVADVSSAGDGDSEVGPTYTIDPNLTDMGNPKGKRFSFTMRSQDSLIYKGDDATLTAPGPFTRGITVYVPAKYKDGTAAPVLVLADGPGEIDLISRALDNLTISTDPLKKIPAFIAIAVANGGGDSVGSERGLEYDTVSARYASFIDTEVLPAVVSNAQIKAAYPNIKLTTDPDGKATYGCSSGGAAALTMGWLAPQSWHRIITYSGTFVAQQNPAQLADTMLYPLGAWEYHSDLELIKNAAQKPLRIFINANEHDNGYTAPASGHHNWLLANQLTAAALAAKSYHYRFILGKGVGHCDGTVKTLTLADVLSWTWRGYPTE
ncbi:MAG TPA: alpha/beta hydrolase-fold protein, partial [Polyangiaceae bacterium]